jgi:opacity protein-like surface antigen
VGFQSWGFGYASLVKRTKQMRSVKSLLAAGAASLFSATAFAADLPIAAPAYAPVAEFGGWYLRGDIGFSNQTVNHVLDTNPTAYNNLTVAQTSSFGSAGIFDIGFGYQFNNWFRADFIAQYRGRSNFTGLDVVTGVGPFAGFVGTDNYTATKSEWLFLANGYVDLGTWWCITPFIGAGIGTALVSVANFTDTGDFINGGPVHSFNYAGQASKWNFAWAAHAGLAYHVTPGFTVELAYSFVSLGSGITGPTYSFDQVTNTTHAAFAFRNIYSNDLTIGVRWDLYSPPPYAPPLVTKG